MAEDDAPYDGAPTYEPEPYLSEPFQLRRSGQPPAPAPPDVAVPVQPAGRPASAARIGAPPATVTVLDPWSVPLTPDGYTAGRPSRRRAWLPWLAAGTVVLAGLGLLGYHYFGDHYFGDTVSTGTGRTTRLTQPGPTIPVQSPPTKTPEQLGVTLATVALKAGDIGPGITVKLPARGATVHGQPTLDNCGVRPSTEKHRVARRQYRLTDVHGNDSGLSNEVVAYDSPSEASRALAQWYKIAAHCPSGSFRMDGALVDSERTLRNDADVVGLPVHANAITIEKVTTQGMHLYLIAVLQVRGRYLDAMWGEQEQPVSGRDLATVIQLAAITGYRLLAVH